MPKNTNIWAHAKPSHVWLLLLSHVTPAGWQHMALLCNSADKERSNLSRSRVECDLLWAGFLLTQTCWFAPLLYKTNVRFKNIISLSCVGPPLPAILPPFSSECLLLYMWHRSRFGNPVQMFSILVQCFFCFQIAGERGLWWEGAQAGGDAPGREADGRQAHPPWTLPLWEPRRESQKKVAAMGQKKDKESRSEKREGSPEAEDGHKCRFCRFPLVVALLQLLLGVAVTVVAFLMLAISPSLLARETPHWAGIIVSSLFSFCLFTCLHVFWYLCMSLSLYPISCCPPSRACQWQPTCPWQIALRKSLVFLHSGRAHSVTYEPGPSAAVPHPDGTTDHSRPYFSSNFSNMSVKTTLHRTLCTFDQI